MALAVASSAAPNLGTILSEALNDYETILTDKEKTQLHSQGPPDAMAAINLATIIDAKNTAHRRQCIGPRLITFLESVQQFSAVVDTFVSGHPDIAALVWGGVKLTLLAANNLASYFDKLSILLMKLGRTCPQFSEFSLLYPSSIRLQKALCEYYAAVIRLCKHSTQLCTKLEYSWFSKAFSQPFDTEFGPYEKTLEYLSQEIRDEISLASLASTQVEIYKERREGGGHRSLLGEFRKTSLQDQKDARTWRLETNRHKSERHRLQVLDSLSTYDHQRVFKQARRECIVGTSIWICETVEFKSWMIEPRGILWCHGRLGSGKTILAACTVAHIAEKASPKDVLSFFFCRFDDAESLKAKTIFGSIARQLVADLPMETFHKFQLNADLMAICDLLKDVLAQTRRYFIILDGLDGCEESQFQVLLKALRSLLDSPLLHCKLFFTSRTSVISWVPLNLQPEWNIVLDTTENQAKIAVDIKNFITTSLQERLQAFELQLGDPALILKIQDTLIAGARGMFLWVHAQLENICAQKTDADIMTVLNNLPRGLSQSFEQILSGNTEPGEIEISRRIFQWVATAKRPLTLEELQEAISIEPLQTDWDSSRLVDINRAIAYCGTLILVEEEQQTVHFTHHSVRQYLISDAVDSLQHYHVDLEGADAEVGAICVTYLNFNSYDRQRSRLTETGKDLSNIPSMVVKEALPHSRLANKITLSLLQRQKKPANSISRPLEEVFGDIETARNQHMQEPHVLLSYAKQFWLEHTKLGLSYGSTKLWSLWCNLIDEADIRDTLQSTPWTYEDWKTHSRVVIEWIVEQNHCALAQRWIELDVNLTGGDFQRLIGGAQAKGDWRLFDILAKRVPKVILNSKLREVAAKGDLELTQKLIQINADVDTPAEETSDQTALQAAIENGHLKVVERLLAANANDNAPAGERYGRTLLPYPTERGHEALLLGSDTKAADSQMDSNSARDSTQDTYRITRSSNTSLVTSKSWSTHDEPLNPDLEGHDSRGRLESTVSGLEDISAQRTTRRLQQAITDEHHLATRLAHHGQLIALHHNALSKIGVRRFIENFQRLLEQYYLELRKEANTNLETASIELLKSEWSRIRIARQIVGIYKSKTEDIQREKPKHEGEQAKRSAAENWIRTNAAFLQEESPSNSPDSFNIAHDRYNSEWAGEREVLDLDYDSSIEETDSESELYPANNGPNIANMAELMLGGSAFQNLITNFWASLFPRELYSLVEDLLSIPIQNVWFSLEEDYSFQNRFKILVESITEQDWDWWPFRAKMRTLGKEEVRLEWKCHCNKHLWIEIPKVHVEGIQQLLICKRITTEVKHLCANRRRYLTSNIILERIKATVGSILNTSGSSSLHTGVSKLDNSHAATQGQQRQTAMLPTPPNASGSAAGPQQNPQVTVAIPPSNESVVLFGTKGPNRTLGLAQINTLTNSEDEIFFRSLKEEYKALRGSLRYWFSVWRLKHCNFVKFKKIMANRVVYAEDGIPTNMIYDYDPRPPVAKCPPICRHEFEMALTSCRGRCIWSAFHDCGESLSGATALQRIPKRKVAFELNTNGREEAWGLQAKHVISFIYMLVYHCLIIIGTFTFWAWWLVKHPGDLQNAAVPLTTVVVLLSLFWGSAGVLKALRESD